MSASALLESEERPMLGEVLSEMGDPIKKKDVNKFVGNLLEMPKSPLKDFMIFLTDNLIQQSAPANVWDAWVDEFFKLPENKRQDYVYRLIFDRLNRRDNTIEVAA